MAPMLARLLLLALIAQTHGLDNGLGRTPGLGWNSDYCSNCSHHYWLRAGLGARAGAQAANQNELWVRHMADHMHTHKYRMASDGSMKTMQELGFRYVNIDANWDTLNRSASGDLVPDPKLYPHGLAYTVDYVHSLGLGFGLYGDRGYLDCGRAPGQLGHEVHDGLWLGRNKVDWFKSDSCFTPGDRNATMEMASIEQFALVAQGMNKSGWPVWWALCDGRKTPPSFYAGPDKYPSHPVGNALANSARIGPDTGGGWLEVLQNLENALPAQQFAGPHGSGGFWNDGCLLLTPGFGCHGEGDSVFDNDTPSDRCVTNRRFQAMYALWTVNAHNLIL